MRVRVIGQDIPGEKTLQSGKIASLPEPEEKEKPEEAGILAEFDSRAHGPEKGDKAKAPEAPIPVISAPLPAAEDGERAAEGETVKKTASLPPAGDREKAPEEPNPFSEAVRGGGPADRAGAEPENRKAERKLAALAPEPQSPAAPETGDVIELGDEAVVSLATKAFEYVDYFAAIRKAINMVWTYPEGAAARGLEGRAVIRFSLASDGSLEDVKVLESSGHRSLDEEASLAIKLAAPYEAFPPALDKKRLHIVATFVYRPTFSSVR